MFVRKTYPDPHIMYVAMRERSFGLSDELKLKQLRDREQLKSWNFV